MPISMQTSMCVGVGFLRACTCEDARTCDDREINSVKSQCTRRQSGYASSIAVFCRLCQVGKTLERMRARQFANEIKFKEMQKFGRVIAMTMKA